MRKMVKDERGQALVEFIIILPLVISMIFILGDVTRIHYSARLLDERFNQVPLGSYYSVEGENGRIGKIKVIDSDTAFTEKRAKQEMEWLLNSIILVKDPWLSDRIDGEVEVVNAVVVRRSVEGGFDELEAMADIKYKVKSVGNRKDPKEVKKRLYTFRYIPAV